MKDYLTLWFEGLSALHHYNLKGVVTVTGKCDRHYGGHSAYAQLRVRLEPATQVEISEAAPEIKFRIQKAATYGPDDFNVPKDYLPKLLDQAILGLFDSVLPNEQAPKPEFRIVFEEIEYCPINSSQMAFRIAGRDAGQNLLETIKRERFDRSSLLI